MIRANVKKTGMTAVALAISFALTACNDNDDGKSLLTQPTVYKGFPVTLDGATGDDSVAYQGQMARHVLRESLKSALGDPVQSTTAGVYAELNNYLKNPGNVLDNKAIYAPSGKDGFPLKETMNSELGTGRNLSGKLYDPSGSGDPIPGVSAADSAKTMGWPGDKTAAEVLDMWLMAVAKDHGANTDGETDYYDMTHGYDYKQLVAKFLMGAVFYNQAVDKYLDENVSVAGVRDNDKPYVDGLHFTGKEHSWDEGFGYYGAAANYAELTPEQNYEVNKMGRNLSAADALKLADIDGDGKVSLYTEYTYGPAYYTASFDKDGKSTYGKDIMEGFLEGRTLIANATDNGVARKLSDAERMQLVAIAGDIQRNWEAVFAEAVYKYAGLSHKYITNLENGTDTSPKSYYHLWSEMKGFMMALQYGGSNSLINAAKFKEIDALMGYGPVLVDGRQVNGIDSAGNYTLSSGNTWTAYKANMISIQKKLDALYGLKAKQYEIGAAS